MNKTESIVKKIQEKISPFDSHLAEIYGEQGWLRPRHYVNTENNENYLYLAGGVAFPTTESGFLVNPKEGLRVATLLWQVGFCHFRIKWHLFL